MGTARRAVPVPLGHGHRVGASTVWRIIWNHQQLERIVTDYIDHYNEHRPHRSLD